MTKIKELISMMYVKERKGKQEAKKVLDELKSNYENLLQKFAAAENALDVVRFGGQPPPVDDSREQTFRLADDFAERIGQFKVEESDLSLIESRNMKIRTSTSQSGQKNVQQFFLFLFFYKETIVVISSSPQFKKTNQLQCFMQPTYKETTIKIF